MSSLFRALIVEDDAVAREATVMALQDEGFVCSYASDGGEAIFALDHSEFDVLVTDLRMPKRNGHSLAVEVIGRGPERPLVVVLTGVLERRLLKDLVAHEVDDIAFKPVNMILFAAKVHALCERRRRQRQAVNEQPRNVPRPNAPPVEPATSADVGRLSPVSQEEVEYRFRDVSRVPTVSEAAINVFKLSSQAATDCQQIAAAVLREPALIADVLRLANCSFFNSSVQKLTSVEEAVARLGQKRVGELALTTATFAAVTQSKNPFFSLQHAWKNCFTAGICLEMLLEHSISGITSTGMFCAAVLQPIGRILLASAFPELYERMLKQGATEYKSLSELESSIFPLSPGEITSTVLASWGIPDSVHRPLRHVNMTFQALSSIGDPLRRRVELIKTAGFLGKVASSQFDPWDLIDIPPAPMLGRLGIQSIDATISHCREDFKQFTSFTSNGIQWEVREPESPATSTLPAIAYKRLHSDSTDFVGHILAASGRKIVGIAYEVPDEENIVVNALGVAAHQVIRCLRKPRVHKSIILADAGNARRLEDYGNVVTIPCTWSRLSELLAGAS